MVCKRPMRVELPRGMLPAWRESHPESNYFPGAQTGLATPVPIPNTVVKQTEPMVLAQAERVGRCRVYTSEGPSVPRKGLSDGPSSIGGHSWMAAVVWAVRPGALTRKWPPEDLARAGACA